MGRSAALSHDVGVIRDTLMVSTFSEKVGSKVLVKAHNAFSSKSIFPVKGISFMDGVGHYSKPHLEFRNAEAFKQTEGKRWASCLEFPLRAFAIL